VTQYLGFNALFLDHIKTFANPKILGHAATSRFISPFRKIYGDGPISTKFIWKNLPNQNRIRLPS